MSAKKIFLRQFIICGVLFVSVFSLSRFLSLQYVGNDTGARRQMIVDVRNLRQDEFADKVGHDLTNMRKYSSASKTVIFDNDAASDDAMALVLLANDPRVDLKAITVTGTGEAHAELGAKNMADLSYALGRPNIPVAFGRSNSLTTSGTPFPVPVRKAMDHLLVGKNIPHREDVKITGNAVKMMRDVIQSETVPVTILATGPLTNIAELLTKYPKLAAKIEKVVIMGGALKSPGNVQALLPDSDNSVSEWNFFNDPAAVKAVFKSGVPVTLVSLDATNQVPITRKFYQVLNDQTELDLKFVYQLNHSLIKRYGEEQYFKHIYMWDALAAMVLLDPDVATSERMYLTVNENNGQIRVANIDDTEKYPISVITKIHQPDGLWLNYISTVKSNHTYAQSKFKRAIMRNNSQTIGFRNKLGSIQNANPTRT